MNRLNKLFVAIFLMLPAAAAAGCSGGGTGKTGGTGPALLKVVDKDGKSTSFSMDDLKALPLVTVTIAMKVQGGPTIKSVLKEAGVTDFKEITLSGSNGQLTLKKDQVDSKTIFDFTNRGTVKLATTHVEKAKWTKDVKKITVK